jgi:RNA methyltransferase, TrmH family
MLASRPARSLHGFSHLKRPINAAATSRIRRISARDNSDFKRFMAVKARKERGFILVEGPKLIEEAIRSGLRIESVATLEPRAPDGLDAGIPLIQFAAPLMSAIADVETNQGVIALARRPDSDAAWLEQPCAFTLILDGVQDPGNVGTLFRTAEAAGVDGVLLARGCADPLSSKALRASAGSAFRMPHLIDLAASDVLEKVGSNTPIIATSVQRGAPSLFDAKFMLPLALALGSEGRGLGTEIEVAASIRVRIPQAKPVESLNVATAGAIALFEIARREGRLRN